MRESLRKILMGLLLALLWSCSGGAGSPEAALDVPPPSGLSNQAGPVERPPVNVDSGPQGDCSKYRFHAEDFKAEEVPEPCLEIWEYALNHPLQVYTPPQVDIPTRVIPTIEGPAVVNQDDIILFQPQGNLHDQLNRDHIEFPGLP